MCVARKMSSTCSSLSAGPTTHASQKAAGRDQLRCGRSWCFRGDGPHGSEGAAQKAERSRRGDAADGRGLRRHHCHHHQHHHHSSRFRDEMKDLLAAHDRGSNLRWRIGSRSGSGGLVVWERAIDQVIARRSQSWWDDRGRSAPASSRSQNDPNQAQNTDPASSRDVDTHELKQVYDVYNRTNTSCFKSHCREKWGGHEWSS